MLLEDQCLPRDSEETAIQNKTGNCSRMVFKVYASIIFLSLSAFFMEPIFKIGDERIKALNTIRPFDLKEPLFFWLTFFQQVLSRSVTPWVHMSVECLIAGLMQQACAQIKILQHRLKTMPALVARCKEQREYRHIDMEYILFAENSTKIKETLYETDWTSLRKDTKFNIITMMICTSRPIVITAGSVIKVNLTSFISIINAAYSAFNVLQQTVKK
ncbi:uncharacterized protein LOC117182929 [Belonocnema kinseyi]|uniref:uncharacterized protein LOC117182929 n=1 Tax=Belonocnema kinseyi TaxID=2817044 RepID=UPI00143DEFDB|nr:uncharacterized protein LOC117182929 [Belonocnema kinseyi]